MIDYYKKYINSPCINQSYLKSILANPGGDFSKSPSLHMVLGSYTDMLLTAPHLIEDTYSIIDINLTDVQFKIMHKIAEYGVWDRITIQKSIDEIGYFNNRRKENVDEDKRVDEFLKFEEIYNVLISNKNIVSKETHLEASQISAYLLSNEITKPLFDKVNYQVPIYFNKTVEIDNKVIVIECKGLLDMLYNDNYVQVRDIKITDIPLYNWKKIAARKFRYDFQLSFYQYGILQHFEKEKNILNPQLIVYSTVDKRAEVFTLSDLDLECGRYGLIRKNQILVNNVNYTASDKIYGWEDGILLYAKHKYYNKPFVELIDKPENLDLWL